MLCLKEFQSFIGKVKASEREDKMIEIEKTKSFNSLKVK